MKCKFYSVNTALIRISYIMKHIRKKYSFKEVLVAVAVTTSPLRTPDSVLHPYNSIVLSNLLL